MPLEFETIAIPFGHGLAEHVAPSLVTADKLATADQGIIDKQGSIEVRPGFQAMPMDVFFEAVKGTASLTAIHRLIGHGGETLLSDGYRLMSYSEGEEQWRDIDHTYEATVAERLKGERGRDTINAEGDVAYVNGYYLQTWYNAAEGKIHARFVDAETGTRFPEISWDSTQVYHRIVVAGELVHVIYFSNTATAIMGITWDTTDLEAAPVGPTTIGATADRPGIFDACSDDLAGVWKVYLAYNYNATEIRYVKLSATLGFVSASSLTATASKCIAITATQGSNVYVAYTATSGGSPDGLCYFVYTDAGALALTPTQIDTDIYAGVNTEVRSVGIIDQGTQALVVYEMRQNTVLSTRVPELRARWLSSAGVLGYGNRTSRIGMLSRPILHEGQPYVVAYYHERSHTHITAHDCPGYPNRYAYLLHIATGECTPYELA